jgi:RHS repeat-associated protein
MQMGVRMYSPQKGRFLSVDPLHELMPGQNSYHYAFNSPLMWRDPSGLVPQKEKNREKRVNISF